MSSYNYIDGWKLQELRDDGWHDLGGSWMRDYVFGKIPMPDNTELRWKHKDGFIQPARANADNHLLAPKQLSKTKAFDHAAKGHTYGVRWEDGRYLCVEGGGCISAAGDTPQEALSRAIKLVAYTKLEEADDA